VSAAVPDQKKFNRAAAKGSRAGPGPPISTGMSENLSLAERSPLTDSDAADLEERFFQRGAEEDRLAREQLRQRLAAMPRWPGLGWAVGMVAAAMLMAAALLFVIPPLR
jgi:hypothetical protein